MALGLGIDTGGTYTDSVIVELATGRVLCKAKALTTRQDLVGGVQASIGKLDRQLFGRIRLVGLSTTLATNAIVEKKGSRVGLVLAVPNPHSFSFPADNPCDQTAIVAGSHDRCGKVAVELDAAAAEQAVRRMAGTVDAFAVSGYFSIYNAEHELRIREMVAANCALPVVCGHELSGDVGLVERAVTAALNARLLPVIGELLAAVRAVLSAHGIAAPLMVVKGDGALIAAELAAKKPVETILSGPAASVVGACRLTGLSDALVVDMGGTTTDIALMSAGMVAASADGAVVGGWKTRVHSVDIRTAGLGGDSKITVKGSNELSIGPRRAIPFCRAAAEHPELSTRLQWLADQPGKKGKEAESEFFTLAKRPAFALSPAEEKLFALLCGRVLDRTEITAVAGSFVSLERFVELGLIAEVAFTPTDLLHAGGELALWDGAAAKAALTLMARRARLSEQTLLELISRELTEELKLAIVTKLLLADDPHGCFQSAQASAMLGALLRLPAHAPLKAGFTVKRPLVAVGAPVGSYFPQVAAELGAELVIPEHAEVANAVGAVTGRVVERAEAVIRPDRPDGFVVVTAGEQRRFEELGAAELYAHEQVRAAAFSKAERSGGAGIEVALAGEDFSAPLDEGWGDSVFIERRISATAVGVPSFLA
jgi:N-methylhydantoinase A/oxoprolinase/acetone carboxylase beta subunit